MDCQNSARVEEGGAKILVRLRKNKSRREIIELRAGRSQPDRKTQELFESMLKRLGFL